MVVLMMDEWLSFISNSKLNLPYVDQWMAPRSCNRACAVDPRVDSFLFRGRSDQHTKQPVLKYFYTMDELPSDLRAFLLNHPFLQLTDAKKIKCTLNGHEFPCNLAELQKFTHGKKYEKLSATAEFNYSQYEPHIVPSTKQPKQLFCKLTLRHLNRQPHHVLRHVNGKRFKKALSKYEECVRQGTEFVPVRLTQKRPKDIGEDVGPGKASKHSCNMWEPASSGEEHSDSEDSMSDLYPSSMFTLKKTAEENMEGEGDKEEEDDFQTDEDEEMEVEKQVVQKRKKVQGGGFQKKFRKNNWKSGRKKQGKVQNGK